MSELMKDLANGDDEENKHLLESNLEENDEENEEENKEEFAALPPRSGDSILFEPDFKKEHIEFSKKINKKDFKGNEKLYEAISDAQDRLNKAASSVLFHWTNVPIVFPPSSIPDLTSESEHMFKNKNLFKFPTMVNELDQVATDTNGKIKQLNKKQLDSIRREGQFEVESEYYPGQVHKWVLARFLQKGYQNTSVSFYNDMSNALYLLIVTAKNRFASRTFSILNAFQSWRRGLTGLLDLLIGLPRMSVKPFQTRLGLDKLKHFVAELTVDSKDQEKFENFCKILDTASLKNKVSWHALSNEMPHFYRTSLNSNQLLIDLRLFDSNIQKSLSKILEDILIIRPSEYTQLEKLCSESIAKLKAECSWTESEIKKITYDSMMKMYMTFVNERLLSDKRLDQISLGVGKLLSEHSRAILLMRQIQEELDAEYDAHIEKFRNNLKQNYRIRSRVSEWLNECVQNEAEKFNKANTYKAHEITIKKCTEQNLMQAAYFIERDLSFKREREVGLKKIYEKIKEPVACYSFKRLIWLPQNWKITPIDEPKVKDVNFTLNKYEEYESDTRYPFWRWKNFFLRTLVNFSNVFFFFGGVLEVDKNYKVLTLYSRLKAVWTHVAESRAKFEATPDKGLIGKSVSRIFNLIWNYVFVGGVGSASLVLFNSAICLSSSALSLLLCVTSPAWYPLASVLMHLLFITIYDWEFAYVSGYSRNWNIVFFSLWRMIIGHLVLGGVCQQVFAALTAFVICPTFSLIVALFGLCRYCARELYDTCMFYGLLKWRARIPSQNTFVAGRVAGPGLGSEYFYKISVEQALAGVDFSLEKTVIEAYLKYVEDKLKEPLTLYGQTFDPIFEPYSYTLSQINKGRYDVLAKEVSYYQESFRKKANKRLSLLSMALNNRQTNSVKLLEKDLNILVRESTKMIRSRHENIILPYQKKSVRQLFIEESCDVNNWTKLTEKYLEKLYGAGILTPIENVDLVFSLEVDHLNLSSYTSMIAESNLRDDLDKVREVHKPERVHLSVQMPHQSTQDLFWRTNNLSVWCSPDNTNLIPFVFYFKLLKNNVASDRIKFNREFFIRRESGLEAVSNEMLQILSE